MNTHLGTDYLAVVETDNITPYFLNLHTRDVAHTLAVTVNYPDGMVTQLLPTMRAGDRLRIPLLI
jgi:hypothetical protein